jgi:hypothetical protein
VLEEEPIEATAPDEALRLFADRDVKEEDAAKYALIAHIESHHYEDG